jgi:hypothetical protein
MVTRTNLAWPDDPYRTGQQLYRRPAPRLAAFTTWPDAASGRALPVAAAVVYLPLHRTRPVTVTAQTLTFGFRAAHASDPAEIPGMVAVADLDLMQARRHAAILTGYHLPNDLSALQDADCVTTRRGLAAVISDWASRAPTAGRADLFDSGLDQSGGPPLEQACQLADITPLRADAARPQEWHPATLAVERALTIALLCARHQGRYQWAGTLDTETVMAAGAWDCLPWPQAPANAALAAADGHSR